MIQAYKTEIKISHMCEYDRYIKEKVLPVLSFLSFVPSRSLLNHKVLINVENS